MFRFDARPELHEPPRTDTSIPPLSEDLLKTLLRTKLGCLLDDRLLALVQEDVPRAGHRAPEKRQGHPSRGLERCQRR